MRSRLWQLRAATRSASARRRPPPCALAQALRGPALPPPAARAGRPAAPGEPPPPGERPPAPGEQRSLRDRCFASTGTATARPALTRVVVIASSCAAARFPLAAPRALASCSRAAAPRICGRTTARTPCRHRCAPRPGASALPPRTPNCGPPPTPPRAGRSSVPRPPGAGGAAPAPTRSHVAWDSVPATFSRAPLRFTGSPQTLMSCINEPRPTSRNTPPIKVRASPPYTDSCTSGR